VAQLIGLTRQRKRTDLATLREVTDAMPESSADSVVPAMRDEARD
jgi:hypothetical protein